MGDLRISKHQLFYIVQLLLLLQIKVECSQYKVGDLSAWGIPTSSNKYVYTNWSKKHQFQLGDSLLFLYPPSQDSLIQVSDQSFTTCNLKNPILYMDDGNSLFNITSPGKYYFTSGQPGHCEKSQKLEISVLSGNGSESSPLSIVPATSPSYQTAFGSMPSTSYSSKLTAFSQTNTVTFILVIIALVGGGILT
ncbi:hypothetical protein GIB67_000915, partial [Kingdonia uniflora]